MDDELTDDFLRHEALHTSHIILEMMNAHLAEHKYISADQNLKGSVFQAMDLIMHVYQEIGKRS